MSANNLLLSYYGDDFTGATDVMEALSLSGVRTVLFLEPPTQEQLRERFPDAQAVGVAGVSRTWTPEQMEARLRPIFEQIKGLNAPLFHYKICSTFDSSPQIGSIGRGIEIGQEVFGAPFVPLVVGAPALRRYVVFGNLFATVGGETYRIDRHPTMRYHPVTPMDEGDLRVHLALQTAKTIGLFDILHLAGQPADVERRFEELLVSGPDVVLFDVLDDVRLEEVGRLIWTRRNAGQSFVVGSSGVEYALTAHWRSTGALRQAESAAPPGPVEQLLVVSGSCSPETERQIAWAIEHGFAEIALDSAGSFDLDEGNAACASVVRQALDYLASGRSLVLHTCRGPGDMRLKAARKERTGEKSSCDLGQSLGQQLGRILHALLRETRLRRVVVAGGDTSGHVSQQLGIYALQMLTPIAPGSPLCRAYSEQPAFDGLEIALKGGQVGNPHYFGQVMHGRA